MKITAEEAIERNIGGLKNDLKEQTAQLSRALRDLAEDAANQASIARVNPNGVQFDSVQRKAEFVAHIGQQIEGTTAMLSRLCALAEFFKSPGYLGYKNALNEIATMSYTTQAADVIDRARLALKGGGEK